MVVAAFTVARLDDKLNIEQLGYELFSLVEQFECRKLVPDRFFAKKSKNAWSIKTKTK